MAVRRAPTDGECGASMRDGRSVMDDRSYWAPCPDCRGASLDETHRTQCGVCEGEGYRDCKPGEAVWGDCADCGEPVGLTTDTHPQCLDCHESEIEADYAAAERWEEGDF